LLLRAAGLGPLFAAERRTRNCAAVQHGQDIEFVLDATHGTPIEDVCRGLAAEML